jgi:3-mercaptopropionate dioxygenase
MALRIDTQLMDEMISRLDEAVTIQEQQGCCRAVKTALEEIVRSGKDFIDPALLTPHPERYARRLIHKDPQDRYSVLAMIWNTGQGTPLHDHDGHWCVECVYRGRIEVTSYSLEAQEGERFRFQPQETVYAGVGDAGALIPPFEYHVLRNPDDVPAVTLHVYKGELDHCHVFVPGDDGEYRRERRELSYTD